MLSPARTAPAPTYTVTHSHPVHVPKTNLLKQTLSVQNYANVPNTPPASPQTPSKPSFAPESLLYPADEYREVAPNIRGITAHQLSKALAQQASTPLPDPDTFFPWAHGIHARNYEQRSFFGTDAAHPPTSYRGIALVHANDRPLSNHGKLVNSFIPSDLVIPGPAGCQFIETEPKHGVGLRNFQIQAVKMVSLSDIVIYDHLIPGAESKDALAAANMMVQAQRHFRNKWDPSEAIEYHVFVVTDPYDVFEEQFPNLVAVESNGKVTGSDPDFLDLEREQMREMSTATEIGENVFLGNTADWYASTEAFTSKEVTEAKYKIHIRTEDFVTIPLLPAANFFFDDDQYPNNSIEFTFPSSGCVHRHSESERKKFVSFCRWLYGQTHGLVWATQGEKEEGKASVMDYEPTTCQPRRVLMSCKDGYTETSFLAIAYICFLYAMPVDEAWVYLHKTRGRNFYAFKEDVMALKDLQEALIEASPASKETRMDALVRSRCPLPYFNSGISTVLPTFNGSFPSRIMDHLYLGNLDHANNLPMLKVLGIERVLSVGERPRESFLGVEMWDCKPKASLYIKDILDDGIDSLTKKDQMERCLAFIDEGLREGQITLVHCRVGVSRSASICIAEVIRRMNKTLTEAYLLVRARRLNVIIQPNLRFMYELLKWEQEERSKQAGKMIPRVIEWPHLARKISRLNRVYIGN